MAATNLFTPDSRVRLVNYLTIPWTSAADGTYSETIYLNGVIGRVATNPGATAPTDNYDVTCTDMDGVDVFYGGGANRDTANSEDFAPLATGSDGTSKVPPMVGGTFTFAVANAGNAKQGVCTIYFR